MLLNSKNKIEVIFFNNVNEENAVQLVDMLNNDVLLQNALSSRKCSTTLKEYLDYCEKWSRDKCAEMFAILLNGKAIGTISLSHQDIQNRTAKIGYWIGSEYWGNGYTTLAFKQVLDYAKHKGFKTVSATILSDNIASLKMWVNNGAEINLKENKFKVSLTL